MFGSNYAILAFQSSWMLLMVYARQMQVLCIQGFLTCRKHAERIILLVEMLQV